MSKIVLLLSILVTSCLAQAQTEVSSKIRNLDLRKCHEKNCIQVKAEFAESGHFTPLMSLRDIKLDHISGSRKSSYSGLRGYIDFERNVVMMTVDSNELLFNLQDMSVKVYKMPKI